MLDRRNFLSRITAFIVAGRAPASVQWAECKYLIHDGTRYLVDHIYSAHNGVRYLSDMRFVLRNINGVHFLIGD